MVVFWKILFERKAELLLYFWEHLKLSGTSVIIAIVIGIPLGIILTRKKSLAIPVVNIINIFQTIPSLALLGFLIPLIGIGAKPAILALSLYSLLAIVKNSMAGINQVDKDLIESGMGMGMTNIQILLRIELPLAVPIIFSGIRIAAVTCIGIATLCAAIGAGGLGQFIFRGISMVNTNMILLGALPTALLALIVDFSLHFIEKKLTPAQQKYNY
ncbi:ABC transporter permease [Spirochaetota bacterium]